MFVFGFSSYCCLRFFLPCFLHDSPTWRPLYLSARRTTRGKSKGRSKASKKKPLRRQQEGAEGDEDDQGEGDEEEEEDSSEEEDEEEEEGDGANLTAHTENSRRMKGKITDQERELLAEKPWALRGEVHSHDRPQNR